MPLKFDQLFFDSNALIVHFVLIFIQFYDFWLDYFQKVIFGILVLVINIVAGKGRTLCLIALEGELLAFVLLRL